MIQSAIPPEHEENAAADDSDDTYFEVKKSLSKAGQLAQNAALLCIFSVFGSSKNIRELAAIQMEHRLLQLVVCPFIVYLLFFFLTFFLCVLAGEITTVFANICCPQRIFALSVAFGKRPYEITEN